MRVLMMSSHNMRGRYFEDFAKGSLDSNLELGFFWLSSESPPNWMQEFKIQNLKDPHSSEGNFFLQVISGLRAISKFKPDLIHAHLFRASIVAIICGRVKDIPCVLTRHHITEHVEVGSRLHQLLDRLSAKFANHVIVFSEAAKDWLIKREGVSPQKITVINQGFDFAKLNPSTKEILAVREQFGFTTNNFNLVCVARYSRTKGQEFLVEAVERLVSVIPEIRLVFVGHGDPEWLAEIIEKKKLSPFVSLESFRDDAPACLAAADLVVHPSLVDAFSQLLIEAQGVGSPLIATDIAAAREQIIDGVTGIIVEERSADALASAILRLYLDRDLMSRIGANAADHVRKTFTVDRMMRETEDCFKQILQNTRAKPIFDN